MTVLTHASAGRRARGIRQGATRPARLLVGMTLPLLLLLAAAGALLAWRDYSGRRQSVITDMRLLARATADDADRFLHDRLEALTLIADSPTVRSADAAAMQTYFRTLADQSTFARVSWVDLAGIRRASNLADPPSGPLVVSGREYFRTVIATGKPYVDAAVTSLQDGQPIVTTAVPTFDPRGALIGVLINPLTIDQIEGILAPFQRRDALVTVIDRANQVIVDANPQTGFQPVSNSDLTARARAQGSGAISGITGPIGQPNRLVGFATAPTGDWVVVSARSAEAAFAPVRLTLIIELATILGLSVAGSGGALWLGRRLVREALLREQAHEAAMRLAAIVASSDDAIIGLTVDGLITSWNAGAEQIFGHSVQTAFGRPLRSLISGERADEITPLLNLLRTGSGVQQYETVGVHSKGRLIELALTLSPIRNPVGDAAGGSVIARDISERKQAEAERELLLLREHAARQAAEAANQTKDEFLQVISHELRTPLTAIVGFAQLLRRRSGTDPQVARMLATIDRSAHVQMRLVDDLLDLSRVMTGKLQLECQPVILATVVEAAVEAARPAITEKAITLDLTLDPAVGGVQGDVDRLEQVVANLLGNAMKFTPRGGRIQVQLDREGEEAVLTVRDSGVGISAEFLAHVFDRFRQADGSPRRAYGGLGLGLAIVRSLVELHGGRTTAASDGAGRGAAFTVYLPLISTAAAHAAAAFARPPTARQGGLPALAGKRLLLVEDDDDVRDLLRLVLEDEGARVLPAASAGAALAALDRELPDLVICDIGLPRQDGYALLKLIRARAASAGGRVPAIAVTAYAAPEDRLRALEAGFQEHLAKPVDAAALVATITAVIERVAAGAG